MKSLTRPSLPHLTLEEIEHQPSPHPLWGGQDHLSLYLQGPKSGGKEHLKQRLVLPNPRWLPGVWGDLTPSEGCCSLRDIYWGARKMLGVQTQAEPLSTGKTHHLPGVQGKKRGVSLPRSTHRELMPCGILKAEGQAGEGRAGRAGWAELRKPRVLQPGQKAG